MTRANDDTHENSVGWSDRVRADAFSTRLGVASNRPNDGTWKCRLGRLAMDGVV
jgi:hypothetical protein